MAIGITSDVGRAAGISLIAGGGLQATGGSVGTTMTAFQLQPQRALGFKAQEPSRTRPAMKYSFPMVQHRALQPDRFQLLLDELMLELSKKWINQIIPQGETGMGYHIATVRLKDGRSFKQVVIDSGFITQIRGLTDIPFTEEEIAEIVVTHDKWSFNAER